MFISGAISWEYNNFLRGFVIWCHFNESVDCKSIKCPKIVEKCPSQLSRVQGDVFKCPKLKDTQFKMTYSLISQLELENRWHFFQSLLKEWLKWLIYYQNSCQKEKKLNLNLCNKYSFLIIFIIRNGIPHIYWILCLSGIFTRSACSALTTRLSRLHQKMETNWTRPPFSL